MYVGDRPHVNLCAITEHLACISTATIVFLAHHEGMMVTAVLKSGALLLSDEECSPEVRRQAVIQPSQCS